MTDDTNATETEQTQTVAPETIQDQPVSVPETVYELKAMDGVQDTDEVKTFLSSIAESLKGSGLSNEQAQALADNAIKTLMDLDEKEKSATLQANQAKFEESKKGLISEWGNSFEANIKACNDLILTADNGEYNGEFEQVIREYKINEDARFVKGLFKIAQRFSEDGLIQGKTAQASAESINEEIKTLMAKPEYFDASLQGHNEIVNKVFDLRKRLQ